jgi:ribosomal protein L5
MQAPKLVKVVVSTGVGSQKDKKKLELIANRMPKSPARKPQLEVQSSRSQTSKLAKAMLSATKSHFAASECTIFSTDF